MHVTTVQQMKERVERMLLDPIVRHAPSPEVDDDGYTQAGLRMVYATLALEYACVLTKDEADAWRNLLGMSVEAHRG